MTLHRRKFLHAAAMSPALAMAPGLLRPASAAGVPVGPEALVAANALDGLSLSWRGADHGIVAHVQARVNGVWEALLPIEADHGHGPRSADGRNHAAPVLVPRADDYRVVPTGRGSDLRHHVLRTDPTLRAQNLVPNPEVTTTVEPAPGLEVIERQNWTYRSRVPAYDCSLGSSLFGHGCRSDVGLRHAVVHHTVNVNDYVETDVPVLLRAIQRYHMDTRGWDDIGYNFVVDRFARIWHARSGDISLPITGGHVAGLNAESVAVAVLGTFSEAEPSDAVFMAIGRLLGWKLAIHGVDPLGMTEVHSTGSELVDRGDMVLLHNISGHRDNQTTSCPGEAIYNRLADVREAAAPHVPLFGVLRPTYTLESITIDGWAIERAVPDESVLIDVTLDGEPYTELTADAPVDDLAVAYPDAGNNHGFHLELPIDLDTWSITATARTASGHTASLMDLVLFAGFIDVEPDRFYAPSVYFLRQHDLTTGTAAGLFEPMDRVTRAQMATFLYRFMGEPDAPSQAPFDDIERPSWYATAVDWLADSGITTGTSPSTFSPDEFITRGQMATFLWRLGGEQDAPDTPFTDLEPGRYYVAAVAWLFHHQITVGTTATTFAPEATLTRGEMATFLHRLALNPDVWAVTPPPPVAIAAQAAATQQAP